MHISQHAEPTLNKIEITFNGERACIRSSEYILVEILDKRSVKRPAR